MIMEVKNLNLSFKDKAGSRKILNDVSFCVEEGQIIAIVGLSGAGKTSLLRTLNLLQPVDSGEIYFQGENIVNLREPQVRKMRKKIGVVFQSFNLFRNRTVAQNIAFPLKIEGLDSKIITKKVLDISHELGLDQRLRAYPSQLSGGEQQRAAIARALMMDPRLILLDEPTSALDPRTTDKLLELIVELNARHKITFIVVTHDMDVIKKTCDRVAYLEKGNLEFFGPAHEFFVKVEENQVRDFTTPIELDREATGQKGRLLRVLFWGEKTHEPIMWESARELDVSLNILYGKIEELKHGPFGSMIIGIEGEQQDLFVERLRESVYSLEEIE